MADGLTIKLQSYIYIYQTLELRLKIWFIYYLGDVTLLQQHFKVQDFVP